MGKRQANAVATVLATSRAAATTTVAGEAVYDPFVGSGTAVIAAEKLGRVCYALNLDPQYVQVAVARWEAFTGRQAVRIAPVELA